MRQSTTLEYGVNTLFTIGFTQKSAEEFFRTLKTAGVRRVVDVRLRNTGQLAGFAKRDDIAFFLRNINQIGYVHLQILAPTADMLRAYQEGTATWDEYGRAFRDLIEVRHIEVELKGTLQDRDCLLCSEPEAARCHRRLVAEYLQHRWKHWSIEHL